MIKYSNTFFFTYHSLTYIRMVTIRRIVTKKMRKTRTKRCSITRKGILIQIKDWMNKFGMTRKRFDWVVF